MAPGNGYNVNKSGGKSESDGFRENGKFEKPKMSPKEGPNPNVNVPKLKQVKGVTEQG